MKQEDIIRMACEVGLAEWHEHIQSHGFKFATPDYLERFAALVAANEREACAEICEMFYSQNAWEQSRHAGAAIRARGEK